MERSTQYPHQGNLHLGPQHPSLSLERVKDAAQFLSWTWQPNPPSTSNVTHTDANNAAKSLGHPRRKKLIADQYSSALLKELIFFHDERLLAPVYPLVAIVAPVLIPLVALSVVLVVELNATGPAAAIAGRVAALDLRGMNAIITGASI